MIQTKDGDEFEVVRLKNRFAEPLFNGYRDALYSVRVRVAHGRVARVRDAAAPAAVIAHAKRTHVYYEYFRSPALAGTWTRPTSR